MDLNTPNTRLTFLIIIYMIYLFFGASVFDAIESPHEARIIRELNEYVRQFRLTHSDCLTDEELNSFVKLVSSANEKGISPLNNVSSDQRWTIGQSVFFAGTVLSTIGYGNVSPLTKGGKLFCMVFAIIGIPVTLVLLGAVLERLMKLALAALNVLNSRVQPYLSALFTKRISIHHMRAFFSLGCTIIVLVFLIIIPAAIYAHIEGWTYMNAFYYCFISISTVGLGDYVPGDAYQQDYRHLYKIASTLYLIIGVTCVVWLLEIYSETPEFNLYKYVTLAYEGQLRHHPAGAAGDNFEADATNLANINPHSSIFQQEHSSASAEMPIVE